MKFNPKLEEDVELFKHKVILVEGKKDVRLLNSLGFTRVFAIYQNHIPLAERINHIAQVLDKKDKVCILTDFDRHGKKLYFQVKKLCDEFKIKTDSKLRGILLTGHLGHIEEMTEFMKKAVSY